METESVKLFHHAEFHGIECIENDEEYGFEGYYMDDINHPDPRPGHAIFLKKKDAEKLFQMFSKSPELISENNAKENLSDMSHPKSDGYVSSISLNSKDNAKAKCKHQSKDWKITNKKNYEYCLDCGEVVRTQGDENVKPIK